MTPRHPSSYPNRSFVPKDEPDLVAAEGDQVVALNIRVGITHTIPRLSDSGKFRQEDPR